MRLVHLTKIECDVENMVQTKTVEHQQMYALWKKNYFIYFHQMHHRDWDLFRCIIRSLNILFSFLSSALIFSKQCLNSIYLWLMEFFVELQTTILTLNFTMISLKINGSVQEVKDLL